MSQLTYPDTATVNYLPNALGQPTQASGYASGVSYWPNGAVAGYTLNNGIVHTLSQNTRGLPLVNRDGGVMQDLYAYDENANVTAITDQQLGQNRSMGYDGLDRLATANSPSVWGSGTYTYDALDNLRTSGVGGRNSIHNYNATTNRLETINTNGVFTGYSYDGQGNVNGRGTQGFYFDRANRLVLANNVASYVYDGHGRRVVAYSNNGQTRGSIYSQSGQLLYGTFAQGMTYRTTRYVYLGGKVIAEDGSYGKQFLHTDGLGSPVARTDSLATLLGRTSYEAYGLTAAGNVPWSIGFTGHLNDPDTGLVYMQQRYYDPMAGRFLSVDPVVTDANTGASFGRYHYANNNPYRYTDPSGKNSVDDWCSKHGSGSVSCESIVSDNREYTGVLSTPSEDYKDAVYQGKAGSCYAPTKECAEIRNREWRVEYGRRLAGQSLDHLGHEFLEVVFFGPAKVGWVAKGLTTPSKYFGSKTKSEVTEELTKKFGSPRSSRVDAETFFNEKSQRSFNVHEALGHMGGKPHVDIRRRGDFEERKYMLKEAE